MIDVPSLQRGRARRSLRTGTFGAEGDRATNDDCSPAGPGDRPDVGTVSDFYKGKQVTFIIRFGVGSTYDLYARPGLELAR